MKKLASFGSYGLHIIQFPSGRYGFVGTVPEVLITNAPSSFETLSAAEEFYNERISLLNKH